MASDNPFEPKFGKGLLGIFGELPSAKPTNALADLVSTPGVSELFRALSPQSSLSPFSLAGPQPTPSNALSSAAVSDLFGALSLQPAANPFGNLGAVADLFAPTPPAPWAGSGLGVLSGHFPWADPPTPFNPPLAPPRPLASPKPVAPAIKRKAFFSFHYDDVMRTSVVRKAWMFKHPDSALMPSFYDSSLWESKKLEDDEAVKRLIRDGVWNTSAVCVLAGSETWKRRWVRCEIARAIIDGRGLLTVHLNSIRHHVTKTAHTCGPNPLAFMAVGKEQNNALRPARYFLYEKLKVSDPAAAAGWRWGWFKYEDYTLSVDLPGWVTDPGPGHVTPLSACADEYDYMADNGHRNIGSWIDLAARRAGR